ncbi:GNAT family N-acetyltransferase [candidate division KSB1 bacterium]|nr:GNAT family N-acetyltransferase [candidate division KSB1 bacterium]
MISIRRIRSGEGELFRELRLASLQESPSAFSTTYASAAERTLESWHEQADSTATGADRSTFLAFSDEAPVGIAAVYRNMCEKEEGEIFQVWISPDFRGSEVARELIETILQWCQENGIRRVLATVTRTNARALRFYRKCGFDYAEICDAPGSLVLMRDIGSDRAIE